jgi:hypothetical protein
MKLCFGLDLVAQTFLSVQAKLHRQECLCHQNIDPGLAF